MLLAYFFGGEGAGGVQVAGAGAQTGGRALSHQQLGDQRIEDAAGAPPAELVGGRGHKFEREGREERVRHLDQHGRHGAV